MLIPKKTDMTFSETGETNFKYNTADFHMQLSNDDLLLINNIFSGKKLYNDNPSCGFTQNVSIILNNTESFYIACDSCPIIYWKNKNKYFRISEKEYSQLKDVLEKYGFTFPCV